MFKLAEIEFTVIVTGMKRYLYTDSFVIIGISWQPMLVYSYKGVKYI